MKSTTLNLIIFNFINSISQFLLIVILTRYYSQIEYATYRQSFLMFEIFAPLLNLGFSSTIFYFYQKDYDKSKLVYTMLFIILILSTLFQLFFWFGGNLFVSNYFNNPDLKYSLIFIGIFAFLSASNTILYSYLILEKKSNKIIYLNGTINIIILITFLIAVFFESNIFVPYFSRIILFLILFLLLFYYSNLKYVGFLGLTSIKSIIKYSYPISVSALIGTLSYQLGNIVVSTFSEPQLFAIYINGAIEIPFISIITSSISVGMLSEMALYIKNNDLKQASSLFKKSANYSALVLFPIFSFSLFFSGEIFLFIFGKSYLESSLVFRIFLFLMPIRIINYGSTLVAIGKTPTLLKRSIIELFFNISLTILFVYFFGYIGGAIGTVLSILLWTVPFNLASIKHGLECKLLELLDVRKLLFYLIISLILGFFIKTIYEVINPFDRLIYFIFCIVFYFSIQIPVAFYLGLIDKSEVKNILARNK